MGVVSKIQRELFNLIRSDSPPDLSMTEEICRVLNISTNGVYRRMGYQAVDTDQWVSERERSSKNKHWHSRHKSKIKGQRRPGILKKNVNKPPTQLWTHLKFSRDFSR